MQIVTSDGLSLWVCWCLSPCKGTQYTQDRSVLGENPGRHAKSTQKEPQSHQVQTTEHLAVSQQCYSLSTVLPRLPSSYYY